MRHVLRVRVRDARWADEMGLGKTVQAISFIAHLYGQKVKGPFIVVVPLSTITNWQREFKRWAPSVDVLLYHGSKEDRQAMRVKHGFERREKKSAKGAEPIPVILTSFEVAMNDGKKLQVKSRVKISMKRAKMVLISLKCCAEPRLEVPHCRRGAQAQEQGLPALEGAQGAQVCTPKEPYKRALLNSKETY